MDIISWLDNFIECPKKRILRPHSPDDLFLISGYQKKQDQDQALPMCLSVFRKSKTLCKQWIMTVISAKTELLDRQRDKVSNGECNNLSLDQLKQRQRQRK